MHSCVVGISLDGIGAMNDRFRGHKGTFDTTMAGFRFRVRALQVHGDPWAEDPECYLTDEARGLTPGSRIREPVW